MSVQLGLRCAVCGVEVALLIFRVPFLFEYVRMQECGFCCFNLLRLRRDINDLPRSRRSVCSGFSVFEEIAVRLWSVGLCCFVTIGCVHRGELHRGWILFF